MYPFKKLFLNFCLYEQVKRKFQFNYHNKKKLFYKHTYIHAYIRLSQYLYFCVIYLPHDVFLKVFEMNIYF